MRTQFTNRIELKEIKTAYLSRGNLGHICGSLLGMHTPTSVSAVLLLPHSHVCRYLPFAQMAFRPILTARSIEVFTVEFKL